MYCVVFIRRVLVIIYVSFERLGVKELLGVLSLDEVQIELSRHARRKLEERMLSLDVVRKVVANPRFVFYDLLSRAFVSVF